MIDENPQLNFIKLILHTKVLVHFVYLLSSVYLTPNILFVARQFYFIIIRVTTYKLFRVEGLHSRETPFFGPTCEITYRLQGGGGLIP